MIQRAEITALVLAAGYSSRMRQFKPLLPMGPTTTLERCVRLFRDAGIQDVRVVAGYRADELTPLLDRLAVRGIVNHRFEEGMFSSVRAGLADLESSTKAFFLLPVDIPLVRRTTVLDLLAASDAHDADIWYPTFLGKRGHPPLITTRFRASILSWEDNGGLRAFFSQQEARTVDVRVADEHILLDMDTPQEYEGLLARLPHYTVPSAAECRAVLTDKFSVNGNIVAHSARVAQVALLLARALNAVGCQLNLKLIVAAALLHDLAKGKPNHAAVGEGLLRELGYPSVAQVVGCHTDANVRPDQPISAQEVVCFADKMVQADRIVPVELRFRNALQEYGDDPKAVDTVIRRLSRILGIKERLENALGLPVESLVTSDCEDPLCNSLQTDTRALLGEQPWSGFE
jgi:molybdenum cofactor cytidylyltransferase